MKCDERLQVTFAPLDTSHSPQHGTSDYLRHLPRTTEEWFEASMPYVITEACIGVKDKACVDVCPVDCIYEGDKQLFIHPDECIDCGACEPECPVTAIFPEEDVPANQKQFVQINRDVFKGETPPGRPTR